MEINVSLDRNIFNPSFYPLLKDYSHRWEIYMGSAGSGKSYFITEKLLYRALHERIRILVCRRYGTTIRQTVFSLFKDVARKWQITPYLKINESDYRITLPNGSEILFAGLDAETKLLSLNDIGTVWCEECYEIPKDIVEQLNLRMRGNNNNQQILMSFNPISSQSWLYEFISNPPESFVYHHSTYKDNKFLSKEYIESLEDLRTRNPQKARIYCDGEWGIDTDGLVFTNWRVEDFDIFELSKKLPHKCGMDFGWLDPSAIVESFYDEANKTIYVTNEFYRSGQTLDNLFEQLVRMRLTKVKVQCDSAEPRTIDFFRRKNINCVPCVKGQNSVDARISFLQNHTIVVHPQCENVIKELSNFSYVKDRNTGKYNESKYTHEYSHSLDALGYSYSDIYTGGRLQSIDKRVLGL